MFRRFHLLSVIALLFAFSLAHAKDLEIAVTLSPAGSYIARAKVTSGSWYHTPEGGVSAQEVVVDLNTLNTGITLRDKHTKERLKVSEHPQAKLLKANGKDGQGTATLELRGQTLDVKGTYEIKDDMLVAKFPVNIKELGINDAKYMGVGVKDIVNVTLEIPKGTAPGKKGPTPGKKKK